jgi:hypothetical protein
MRKRGAQVATTQMGRMGAEDPSGISGHTLLLMEPFESSMLGFEFADDIT